MHDKLASLRVVQQFSTLPMSYT